MKLTAIRKQFKQLTRSLPDVEPRVLLTATSVAGFVVLMRLIGVLQAWELAAMDQIVRMRPSLPLDERIVIVGIEDSDINHIQAWPIPDRAMAQLLTRIKSHNPRAIGLDIYRDVPVGEGRAELEQIFKTTPNLIGIEKISDEVSFGVNPPQILEERNQIGFNNVIIDTDGRVRRSVLFYSDDRGVRQSFALQLALLYLKQEGITSEPAPSNPMLMQLGRAVFRPLRANDGGYVRADDSGYQILANLRGPSQPFPKFAYVSFTDVLQGKVSPELMRDRIVVIGSTAASLKDFFYTSYSSGSGENALLTWGVELQAHFISQLLDAAYLKRSPIDVIPKPLEILWIWSWSMVGATLSWRLRSSVRSALGMLTSAAILSVSGYLAFLAGWWIPVVPPILALLGSAVAITGYIAYLEEELKKSKEFLSSVINTIPDPIFVKDQKHRWIVLNDAFCNFIGYPLEKLLEKTDCDFFPTEQTHVFRKQDEKVFLTGIAQESEEEFTNANGVTFSIATKRSLHRDAAGNRFLVGAIRDITERKRIEEELRQTAAELVRSNAELRQAEDRLRRMAYYDTLTNLPNRDLLHERLAQAIDWAKDHDQLIAILFLDLDGFKRINDTHGHQMGNMVLRGVAQRLTNCLRGSDTVARLGGDEFVVMLPAVPSPQDVSRVANKILDALSKPFVFDGVNLVVTTSLGISLYPSDGSDIETLLKEADMAMYNAKGAGKNCYHFSLQAEHSTIE